MPHVSSSTPTAAFGERAAIGYHRRGDRSSVKCRHRRYNTCNVCGVCSLTCIYGGRGGAGIAVRLEGRQEADVGGVAYGASVERKGDWMREREGGAVRFSVFIHLAGRVQFGRD